MGEQIVAAVTRRAAEMLSRRSSLMALGGVAFATVAAKPTAAKAGKAGKKARRRCQRQGRQCRATLPKLCEANELDCEAILPCCDFFARCQAPAGIRCIFVDPPQDPDL